MKRVYPRIVLLVVSGLVCLLFLLAGCKKGTASAQNVPLDAETINTALKKAKLSGVFAESETYTNSQGHVHYVLQNPSYSSESIDDILFVADVSAFDYGGERLLFSVFYQKLDTSDIDWDAWKPQLDFAALLYDGFENPEDVYQAFCGKELPGPPDNNKTYKWEASLPEGYCIVNYMPYSYKTHDENGFEVIKHSATFQVNIYESFEVYQKIQSHTEDVSIALRNSD